jgi:rubredoxin
MTTPAQPPEIPGGSAGSVEPGDPGTTPASAATIAPPEPGTDATPAEAPPEKSTRLDRHECRACGYVYEPQDGDGRRNIAPNTPFEEVPGDWVCPVCRAPKIQFINIGPKENPSGFEENLSFGLGVNVMTASQKRLLIFGGLVIAFLFLMSFYGLK